jgi:hypothetical protein
MGKASLARSGGGNVSKAAEARGEVNKMVVKPEGQPSVPSNIPGAGPAGVPPAEADKMGEFARQGNYSLVNTEVAAQRGQTAYGPPVASSVARSGGQIGVAPGQFGVWARPIR